MHICFCIRVIALRHINSFGVKVLIGYQGCPFKFENLVQRGETIQLFCWRLAGIA
jgi:hypothetical protein